MTTTTRNIIEELKRAATEQGAGEAVRTIAGPALETWMRALDGKDADPERLDDLATLMTARLSIRDAALIAAIEPKLDTATVIDMAARPHASNNKTLLTETLKAAFDDPPHPPRRDPPRPRGAEACAMADRARKHGGPVAQPLRPRRLPRMVGRRQERPPPSPPSPHWTTTRKPASPSWSPPWPHPADTPHTCADRQKTAVASDGTRHRTPRRKGHDTMHANTIETTANQQGWTLHTGFAGGQWLETSSPAGEDLIIDVPSGRPIPETVHEHAEQFDPDEHVRALVRSPMKGQPGTIAELLEDAKAIQTMLDRLDAALSAPPDDDPPLGAMDGRSARRNARRRGAQGLQPRPNRPLAPPRRQPRHRNTGEHPPPMPRHARRPARPHEPGRQPPPPHMTEKENADGRPVIERVPARIRQADGDGPGGARGSRRPFANPGRPTPPDPTRRRAPPGGTTAKRAKPYQTKGAAPPACPLPGCKAQKGAIIASVRVHAADTARFPRTEPAPKGGAAIPFSFSAGRLRLWIVPASRNPSTRHATGCARRDR